MYLILRIAYLLFLTLINMKADEFCSTFQITDNETKICMSTQNVKKWICKIELR